MAGVGGGRCHHLGGPVEEVRKGTPWSRPYRKGIVSAALGTISHLRATFLTHPPHIGMIIFILSCEHSGSEVR